MRWKATRNRTQAPRSRMRVTWSQTIDKTPAQADFKVIVTIWRKPRVVDHLDPATQIAFRQQSTIHDLSFRHICNVHLTT